MKTKILILTALVAMVSITSCTKYPASSGRLTEDLVIYTKYDQTVDFKDYQTFAIVPKITYIDGKDSTYLNDSKALALLNRITSNMVSRGFLKVDSTDNPDLGVNVTAIKNTNTVVYYPGWYWGYPAYYSPGWWGYPDYDYYYPYYPTYITSYSSGTVVIDLVDFKNKSVDKKIFVRWNAYIRALLTGSHTENEILKSVDQAFTQTPSLKTTPLAN